MNEGSDANRLRNSQQGRSPSCGKGGVPAEGKAAPPPGNDPRFQHIQLRNVPRGTSAIEPLRYLPCAGRWQGSSVQNLAAEVVLTIPTLE
jgi:hypothetical protein